MVYRTLDVLQITIDAFFTSSVYRRINLEMSSYELPELNNTKYIVKLDKSANSSPSQMADLSRRPTYRKPRDRRYTFV